MISVLIGTYGGPEWVQVGDRALASATPQTPHVIRWHMPDGTLAQVRNGLAAEAHTEWLCFLDGDDELAPGYIDAMRTAAMLAERTLPGPALLVPQVQYVRGGRRDQPKFPREVPVEDGNWLVIGTVVPRDLFWKVGGFEEFPMYEDWALFARMQKAGATPIRVPDAVYVAHRRPRSRNHEGGRKAKLAAHDQVRRAVFPELYDDEAAA